ncbi:MAG: hypothetical protein LBH16_06390 [Treponema sp.]|nr:hypothetical protein [Treponema sp.]
MADEPGSAGDFGAGFKKRQARACVNKSHTVGAGRVRAQCHVLDIMY